VDHKLESAWETITKTRPFLTVFPLVLSLLAFNIYIPPVFFHHSELFDSSVPEFLKDYFPASAESALVASKPKTQILLWHDHLCLQVFQKTYQPEPHLGSAKTVTAPTNSWVALTPVMRC